MVVCESRADQQQARRHSEWQSLLIEQCGTGDSGGGEWTKRPRRSRALPDGRMSVCAEG